MELPAGVSKGIPFVPNKIFEEVMAVWRVPCGV